MKSVPSDTTHSSPIPQVRNMWSQRAMASTHMILDLYIYYSDKIPDYWFVYHRLTVDYLANAPERQDKYCYKSRLFFRMLSNNPKPPQVHSRLTDTAFPKINGKRDVFLSALRGLKRVEGLAGEVILEGIVKLHGSHADIVFEHLQQEMGDNVNAEDSVRSQGKVKFQSRNREVLSLESQNGWPKQVAQHTNLLFDLKQQILTRFQQKNPHLMFDPGCPIVIAGEWIGEKVQRDVGVSRLTTRFVILAIKINGEWQNDADYADVEAPGAHIFNIQRAPKFQVPIDLRFLSADNPAFERMQQLADEVEACCPFAATFGIEKSQGEGIVWKTGTPRGRAQPSKWFKTKGPIASGMKPQPLIDGRADFHDFSRPSICSSAPRKRIAGKRQTASPTDIVARSFVTDQRVEQGFEYLAEMCIDSDSAYSWQAFSDWVVDDVFEEDLAYIQEIRRKFQNIPGFKVEAELRKSIIKIARERHFEVLAVRKALALQEARAKKAKDVDHTWNGQKTTIKSNIVADPAMLSNDFSVWMRSKDQYMQTALRARQSAQTIPPSELRNGDNVKKERKDEPKDETEIEYGSHDDDTGFTAAAEEETYPEPEPAMDRCMYKMTLTPSDGHISQEANDKNNASNSNRSGHIVHQSVSIPVENDTRENARQRWAAIVQKGDSNMLAQHDWA